MHAVVVVSGVLLIIATLTLEGEDGPGDRGMDKENEIHLRACYSLPSDTQHLLTAHWNTDDGDGLLEMAVKCKRANRTLSDHC